MNTETHAETRTKGEPRARRGRTHRGLHSSCARVLHPPTALGSCALDSPPGRPGSTAWPSPLRSRRAADVRALFRGARASGPRAAWRVSVAACARRALGGELSGDPTVRSGPCAHETDRLAKQTREGRKPPTANLGPLPTAASPRSRARRTALPYNGEFSQVCLA